MVSHGRTTLRNVRVSAEKGRGRYFLRRSAFMRGGILSFSSMMWNTRMSAAHRSAGVPEECHRGNKREIYKYKRG
jgi:hypothetical protein